MISIIFSMHIDILNGNYKMKHIIKPNETIILNAVGSVLNIRHLLNWAVLTNCLVLDNMVLLMLSHVPRKWCHLRMTWH